MRGGVKGIIREHSCNESKITLAARKVSMDILSYPSGVCYTLDLELIISAFAEHHHPHFFPLRPRTDHESAAARPP